jgi:phosphotransferase system HPr-like phosphotransfer protein
MSEAKQKPIPMVTQEITLTQHAKRMRAVAVAHQVSAADLVATAANVASLEATDAQLVDLRAEGPDAVKAAMELQAAMRDGLCALGQYAEAIRRRCDGTAPNGTFAAAIERVLSPARGVREVIGSCAKVADRLMNTPEAMTADMAADLADNGAAVLADIAARRDELAAYYHALQAMANAIWARMPAEASADDAGNGKDDDDAAADYGGG